jgi:NADH pyrophosphatase NudC (nudix superfamily)
MKATKFHIKTRTIKGELSKQYFILYNETVLEITKLILSCDSDIQDMTMVKKYKHKHLHKQTFAISAELMNMALSVFNTDTSRYCPNCGWEKEPILYTDANSKRVCMNMLCKLNKLYEKY